jgi:hypothetical protein
MGPMASLLGQILVRKKWKKKPRGVNRLYGNGSRRQYHQSPNLARIIKRLIKR